MTRKFSTLVILLLVLLTSCQKEFVQEPAAVSDGETRVLQQRDPNLRVVLKAEPTEDVLATRKLVRQGFPAPDSYLGCAYKFDAGLFGTVSGVKFPLVDINRLMKDEPSYVIRRPIRQTIANYVSFSSFQKYQTHMESQKKIKKEADFSLGIFSAGAKSEFNSLFKMDTENTAKTVFGQLDMLVSYGLYELRSTDGARKRISQAYLDRGFLYDLYNMPTKNLLSQFGEAILTGYTTGGRATVLYAGTFDKEYTSVHKEKSLDREISASFKLGPKSGSIKGSSYNKNVNTQSGEKSFTSLRISSRLDGGAFTPTFSPAQSLEGVNISLNGWLASLENPSKHTIVDIAQEGLAPIVPYVREINFRNAINREFLRRKLSGSVINPFLGNLKHSRSSQGGMSMPVIRIEQVKFFNSPNYLIRAVLNTRFGDEVIIRSVSNVSKSFSNEEFWRIANGFKSELSPNYSLEIQANPTVSFLSSRESMRLYSRTFDWKTVREKEMKKFKHPHYPMSCLLFSEGGKRYAFSIYGDFILDTYGIRGLYNNAPQVNISLDELDQYEIIGL